jgi:hypothetical protein
MESAYDVRHRGRHLGIGAPRRTAGQDLDNIGGNSEKRADLPQAVARAKKVEHQSATPGSQDPIWCTT